MSSFTHEQVSHFREVFNQFSDESLGGIGEDNFVSAIYASLEATNFAGNPPSAQYLKDEFERIVGPSRTVQWQEFFQVSRLAVFLMTDCLILTACVGPHSPELETVCFPPSRAPS